LNQNTNNFITALITQACHDGFFKILQLIVSLCQNELKNIQIPIDHFYYSGNLSIYNLMKEKVNTFNMNHSNVYPILSSIERKHNKLVMDVINKGEIVLCNGSSFSPVFSAIAKKKNIELFNFLRDKYTFDRIDNLYLMYKKDKNYAKNKILIFALIAL
ncbi:hypothetical protein, partial [Helicobacter japonicus]|uniref:hypothetical protein n=1 Tax=Helicobacter japonicus TaxID=425400 RepID=UPI0025B364A1